VIAGRYVDPADDYEAVAEYCAAQGMAGPFVDQLAIGLIQLAPTTLESIQCDPEAFRQRVSDYAYGLAMGR
jgi:hypothetical protein